MNNNPEKKDKEDQAESEHLICSTAEMDEESVAGGRGRGGERTRSRRGCSAGGEKRGVSVFGEDGYVMKGNRRGDVVPRRFGQSSRHGRFSTCRFVLLLLLPRT